mgnify:CR=1 FL=1
MRINRIAYNPNFGARIKINKNALEKISFKTAGASSSVIGAGTAYAGMHNITNQTGYHGNLDTIDFLSASNLFFMGAMSLNVGRILLDSSLDDD